MYRPLPNIEHLRFIDYRAPFLVEPESGRHYLKGRGWTKFYFIDEPNPSAPELITETVIGNFLKLGLRLVVAENVFASTFHAKIECVDETMSTGDDVLVDVLKDITPDDKMEDIDPEDIFSYALGQHDFKVELLTLGQVEELMDGNKPYLPNIDDFPVLVKFMQNSDFDTNNEYSFWIDGKGWLKSTGTWIDPGFFDSPDKELQDATV